MFRAWLFISLASSAFAGLLVQLPDGQVRGREIQSGNGSFYAFQGIPFASPPLGKLRFQAPVPPQPWDGIRESNSSTCDCVGLYNFLRPMSEDCLYINVYTPAREITEKLPVLVWIYGGGYFMGSCAYEYFGPDELVKEDIIVVAFNYRLGLFGFLSTGDNAILGNAGLKDQLLALKWTKDNIARFGGDPDKITISGQSAGAISVGAHLVNKKAAGLFRGAICQSGSSLMNVSLTNQDNAKQVAYSLAKSIDPSVSDQNTTQEIKDLLQNVPLNDLQTRFILFSFQTGLVVEADDDEAYVTEWAFPLLESGNFNRVPLLIGYVSEESLAFLANLPIITLKAISYDTDVKNLLPYDFVPKEDVDLVELGNLIKKTYVGENGSFLFNLARVLEYYSDNIFVRSILKQAELQSNFTPVYLYEFSYYGSISQKNVIIPDAGKVAHADDIPYLFKSQEQPLVTESDFLTSKRMVRLWANFVKTLNPTPEGSDDPLLNVTWPQVSPTNIQYLDIDETLQVKPNRKVKQCEMWDKVFYTSCQHPFTGF